MAKVIPIGEPVNDAERQAIAHLRDHLPDSYTLLHNFEIERGGELFEIDLAVLAPHAVYLVDVKGTRGLIDVYGSKWYPDGRQPYTSPLLKLRAHARAVKGIIVDGEPGRRELSSIYVDAVVLLSAPGVVLQDPGGRDAPSVTTLEKAVAFFRDAQRLPGQYRSNITALHNVARKAIQGVAKARSGPLQFGNWEVRERLSSTDAYTEYRAVNVFAGSAAGTVLLRAYQADPYLPQAEREAQRARIANAYAALNRLPGHPGIVGARDFFATEAEDRYILVTEDVPGRALRLHIDRPNLALTLDQKLRVATELLRALEHAHRHEVVHRNLTPTTILVGKDGQVHVTGFDFARAGSDRSRTIAGEIVEDLEPAYMAPELYGEPSAASPNSDVFSAGLILYELFTGERPFADPTEIFDVAGVFGAKPSEYISDLPASFDDWLQDLCRFDPDLRLRAGSAATQLGELLAPPGEPAAEQKASEGSEAEEPESGPEAEPIDYSALAPGDLLTHKYIVQGKLGKPGAFGVVYKVIDTLGDVTRVVKLVLRDRQSTLERLKKEYQTLLRIPDHPRVVKVIDADILSGGGPPFIVFEFIRGEDVGELLEENRFSVEDGLTLGKQVVEGLVHLHRHGVYHCDIKPRNLLWTDSGARIIDFNVSVMSGLGNGFGGGTRHYLPPDVDLTTRPEANDLVDRDLYALGITLYEAVTGRYPWDTSTPPAGKPPQDPRELPGLSDLSPDLVEVMLRSVAPRRADRFPSAIEIQEALSRVRKARRHLPSPPESISAWAIPGLADGGSVPPNTNPYVRHLLTLYSQSQQSNAGTRGLDLVGEQTYVATLLDQDLLPAVLAGEFKLVVITGNAGDGKTAFLQKLEAGAREEGAELDLSPTNGCRFNLHGRTYLSNYDGSQDEGDQSSDAVLSEFFAPFQGGDGSAWPESEVRLVAINEGRLVDFLDSHSGQFPLLQRVVHEGLVTGQPDTGVAVVNLNLRSVVTDPQEFEGSILERLVRRMTHEKFWEPCLSCNLKDRCYAFHNARTFQDETAGPKVTERLKTLYTLTHLRGRLHITLRDLRSALAFMLAGTRDCGEIHQLYQAGHRDEIANGFYFNSWMGGEEKNVDRLLSLLKELDVGRPSDPRLDREIDFVSPSEDRGLFGFEDRSDYDRAVLRRFFEDLPRDFSGRPSPERIAAHRRYVAMVRRRSFFERRDGGWKQMLPYRSADRMLELIRGESTVELALPDVLDAINRGEGLSEPERLQGKLALRVRQVENGTIRSYRLFPLERFSLTVGDDAGSARFVEHMPSGLVLRYAGDTDNDAELLINLDVFEMLQRLNGGYRPSLEQEQGFYLSLSVFKNLLASAPYQEVLLTTTGHDFFRIERHEDGRLEMGQLPMGAL